MKSLSGVLVALLRATALSAVFAFPVSAQSQATSGQISGRVVDASGAVVPGVTVRISNAETGFTRDSVTNDEGVYTAPLIPTGTYELTAELSGFKPGKVIDVHVTVGSNLTVNLTLGVAGVEEAITVTGRSAVETTSSTPTSTLNLAAIENLPINGRRFQDFVLLTPTAQIDNQRQQISISGQRGINATINIDGADYSQPFFGGIRGGERSNFAFTVPQEAIREFQVVASGFSAEFGRSSGGIVNVVTKSGSNTMRGSAFYLNRNQNLARKNVFGDDVCETLALTLGRAPEKCNKAVPTQQQFGGSAGGPLSRDRAFFFAAYEQQEVNINRVVLFENIATFSPTPATQEAFNFLKSLEMPFTQTNDAKALLGRVDYQFNAAHRVNVRYSHSRSTGLNATNTGNPLFPTIMNALSNNGTEKDQTNSVVGQLTSVFSPQMLFETRAQYSREKRPRLANAQQPTVSSNVGNYGSVSFLPNEQFDWRTQVSANLTWIKGNHTTKFGTEYNHIFVDQTFSFNQFGAFTFTTNTPSTLLDIMSVGGDIPNRFDISGATQVNYDRQIGNGRLAFSTDEIAFFAQDAWRIRPNFTLHYGLRWEGQYNPTPEANNPVLINRVRGVTFPSGTQVDPTRIPDATDQISPRIGFAWDPQHDAKTVIRGFAGVYYARTPALLLAGPMNNFRLPPGDLSIRLPLAVPTGNPNNTVYRQLLLIGVDLNRFTLDNLPILTIEQVQSIAQALGVSAPDPFRGVQPLVIHPDYQNPESYQFGLGGERQLREGLTVGADFSYVKTIHLQRNRDINLPLPTIRPDAVDPARRPAFLVTGVTRPVVELGRVLVRETSARSLFRALTLRTRLERRWGQAHVAYVLSKSQSDDDNERNATGLFHENPYDLRPEYSNAELDRRHQFSGSVLFYLQSGFDVASSFTLRSGVPVDARVGSDRNLDTLNLDRPYSAPGVPFERNAFRNRSQYDVSVRIQKAFEFNGPRAIVSAEIFNVFDFDNIQYAGTAVTNYCATTTQLDCGFGAPTNVNFLQLRDQNPASTRAGKYLLNNNPGPPLQLQLGVRFQF